jgi:hypothetical protein
MERSSYVVAFDLLLISFIVASQAMSMINWMPIEKAFSAGNDLNRRGPSGGNYLELTMPQFILFTRLFTSRGFRFLDQLSCGTL